MPENYSRSPRRRPVDVLFGETVELKPKPTAVEEKNTVAQAPGYMVEAPRPVTSLRPPPPEFPTDWQVVSPEPVVVAETPALPIPVTDPVAPPPMPVMTEMPRAEVIAEAVTFTTPERREPPEVKPAPVPEPAPVVVPVTAPAPSPVIVPQSLYGQTELVELSQFVDQLYQNVADETSDSAALNAECLANLKIARAALEKGEYARAETSAEQVKARLLLARNSRAASVAPNTRAVMVWLIIAAFGGLLLFALPFVFRFVPALVPLLRGVGMGMLGGALAALWQMTRQFGARTYESGFTLAYAVLPLLGAGLGAVLYLLSLLGIVAAPNALGIPGEPWLMYLFAFVGGFFVDRIFSALRSIFARKAK